MSILDANEPLPTPGPDPDLELIKAIGTRFVSRRDVKAHQGKDGAWYLSTDDTFVDGKRVTGPRLPFTLNDFKAHLAGTASYGHYLLSTDSKCKFFCFDIDLDKTGHYIRYEDDILDRGAIECNPREAWLDPSHEAVTHLRIQLRCMAEGLAYNTHRRTGLPVAVSDSGHKGLHVYCFMPDAEPAHAVRAIALDIIEGTGCFEPAKGKNFYKHKFGRYPNLTIEMFPKQDTLDGKDLGNLMALPLGVHRKTGNPRRFISLKNPHDAPWITMDPLRALSGDLPWE